MTEILKFFLITRITKLMKLFIPTLKDNQGSWMECRQENDNFLIDEFFDFFKGKIVEHCDRLEEFIEHIVSN